MTLTIKWNKSIKTSLVLNLKPFITFQTQCMCDKVTAMADWSEKLSFHEFSQFCEASVKEKKKEKRVKNLGRFLTSCRAKAGQQSLFPLLRFLLPNMDKDRGAYRIKETLLASLYAAFLQLGPTSKDALLLKNFRAPKSNPDDAGDFAAVLFTVMKDRGYSSTDLTCLKVNATLDSIVQRSEGREGTKEVEKLLKEMFLKMDPVGQKWFVRLILKDLKIGLGPTAILSAFHPDASALLDVQVNTNTFNFLNGLQMKTSLGKFVCRLL